MASKKTMWLFAATTIFITFAFSGMVYASENNSTSILYAGQTTNVGTVNVSNDTEYLYITYETTGNWTILETHLEIVNNSADFPINKGGNIVPGQFTYKNDSYPAGTITAGYVVPMDQYLPLENNTLYIAAKATVSDGTTQEGAWVTGTAFSNSSWAGYFTYTVPHMDDDDGTGDDGTGDDGTGDDGTGDDGTGDDGTGDDGTGDDGTGDDGTGDDGTGDDGTGDDGTGDDGTGDDGTGDDGTGDDGTGDDGTGDDGTGDDGTGDDGTGDDGTGDDGTGDDGTGDDGTGDDGTGDDGTGDDGTGDDGTGDDGTGDDGTGDDGTGDDGTGDDGTGDDGTGDEGTGDEIPAPSSGGSGGSIGIIGYTTETEQVDDDNDAFRALDIEEEPEPQMSVPEPVYETIEQEPVMPDTKMTGNVPWIIVWILLAAISIMSIYGYRQP